MRYEHSVGGTVITWMLRIGAIILSLTAFYTSWHDFVENRSFSTHGKRVLVEPNRRFLRCLSLARCARLVVAAAHATPSSAPWAVNCHTQRVGMMTGSVQRVRIIPVASRTARPCPP